MSVLPLTVSASLAHGERRRRCPYAGQGFLPATRVWLSRAGDALIAASLSQWTPSSRAGPGAPDRERRFLTPSRAHSLPARRRAVSACRRRACGRRPWRAPGRRPIGSSRSTTSRAFPSLSRPNRRIRPRGGPSVQNWYFGLSAGLTTPAIWPEPAITKRTGPPKHLALLNTPRAGAMWSSLAANS